MPAPNGDFRFVDREKAFRSTRIPAPKWAQHQAEVTDVYLRSRSLAAVKEHMLLNHGFDAT
jgi:hypothetical protein